MGSTERGYGLKKEIHIWITPKDYDNANLMILLSYIILGHEEWNDGLIKIFAVFPEKTIEEERDKLFELIEAGQLPISKNNIQLITQTAEKELKSIICSKSKDADLTILGVRDELIKKQGVDVFEGLQNVGNTIFVNAAEGKRIK